MPFRSEEWGALAAPLTGELAQAMAFLRDHLPQSDLDCYPPELFLRFAQHAISLRETVSWCGALDWEIFAHYVLFPRVNDEDLSFHRTVFHDALWPRICGLPSMEERVLEVDRWCCEQASYQAQDERTASPLTVYRCGSGRCGEESAFLVSALRSVGIPARQVYAPRWSHCDDNHAWVEALCDGRWRSQGACEPEPVLDRGWFDTAASRAMLVHSRVFGTGSSPLHGEPLGREGEVSWFSQTARYADTRERILQALSGGRPAAGAKFQLQILNEASFHTIAVLTAGEDGTARAALGRGSLHVLAELGGLTAEGECGQDGLVLHLAPPRTGDVPWTDLDFRAPAAGRPAAVLSPEQKAERAGTLRRGAQLRQERLAGCSRPGRPDWEDLRAAARGNWEEIRSFLEGADSARRERLVRTLSDKDLRDADRDTLEDHFVHLPPCPGSVPEDVYWRYTACPRIALEPLTPWRGPLARRLDGWPEEPAALWQKIKADLASCAPAYGDLYWGPAEALSAGRCDEKSRRLLLTAALRTLGVPARLRPLDGAPEFWAEGRFQTVAPEQTGTLRLTAPDGRPLRAGQDWSISRRTGSGWQLLRPGGGWRDGALRLDLPTGQYRLTATVRLPSGDQLARTREIALGAGEERTVPLSRRPWSAEDLLCRQDLPALAAEALDGTRIGDLSRMGDGPVLALWLEEGCEPTEHMLNELMEREDEVEMLPVRLLFLVRGRDSLSQPTLAAALERLSRVQVLLDDWAYDLEAAARCLGRDPDAPPLAVLCDGAGTCLYSASGYRAGGVELLLRAAQAAFPSM